MSLSISFDHLVEVRINAKELADSVLGNLSLFISYSLERKYWFVYGESEMEVGNVHRKISALRLTTGSSIVGRDIRFEA